MAKGGASYRRSDTGRAAEFGLACAGQEHAATVHGSFDQEQIRQATGLPRGRIDRALLAGGVDGIRFSACVHDQVEGVIF